MALRSCLVSCRDLAGTEHAVEVTAETLFEAVAEALGILRGDLWVEEVGEGLTELKARVKQRAGADEGFPAVADGVGELERKGAVIGRESAWRARGIPCQEQIDLAIGHSAELPRLLRHR